MKRIVCPLVIGLTLLIFNFAHAYVVDGLVGDWGVDFNKGTSIKNCLDTTLPDGGLNINFTTKDNAGPQPGWQFVGPGYSHYGNEFDLEATYFNNNANSPYLAIVTGLPISREKTSGNSWFYPGDIGLDVNNDGVYEYGIDVREYNASKKKAKLYKNLNDNNWQNIYFPQFGAAHAWQITSGFNFDWVDFIYSGAQDIHYDMGANIPVTSLDLDTTANTNLSVHWTAQGGKDSLVLLADVSPLPEPGTWLLFGSGILGLIVSSFKKFFDQIKRGIDIFIAGLAIVFTAPLWILIASAIKLTSKGPVFFNQERVGVNKRYSERRKESRGTNRRANQNYGRPFIMYKFRTMQMNAEKETGAVWAMENDPRITPIGSFLRKSHLDELPQMINVLKGEMSIIGPRPERAQIIPVLNKSIKKYNKRLRVKPGITGLAQVRQRYDSTMTDVKKKVHYDLLYIKKKCLLMDLRIIYATFIVMLTGRGAR
ncbi:MAG: sugar transferase [bacterium]|nr:sugar transferase [bacterium]